MTHDELLMRLWEKRNSLCENLDVHFALSAIVELHKPTECSHGIGCLECGGMECATGYPCPTIQAIEKVLHG
jgi:hypothetical protein